MLYYDRIDVSKEIEINEKIASKQCDICHFCYFLDKGLKFQLCTCMAVMIYWWCLWALATLLL